MKITKKTIIGLSKKEIEIVASLEFHENYFFVINDVKQFFENKTQQYNVIKNLIRKKRIVKLNREKYYLIPIKAKSGTWSEHPHIIADEIFNGKDYFIGGWGAANYWRLTDQIPFRYDIYTTKRQGRTNVLNTRFVFHRTTQNKVNRAVTKKIEKHPFRILNKKEMKKWMKLRQ